MSSGEAPTPLAHRCSLYENFHTCMNLKHNGVWGWSIYCLNGRGIYGLNRWVIYGLNGWGIFDLNGWGKICKGKLQRKGRRNFQQKQAAEREKHTRSGKQQVSAVRDGLQSAENSSNECDTCLGAFEGDIVAGKRIGWKPAGMDSLQLPLYL